MFWAVGVRKTPPRSPAENVFRFFGEFSFEALRRKLEDQLARTTGGIGAMGVAMGDHGHAFAIGVAAGVAASILAWKCLGSDKLAASFARPGAAATLKTGREAAPPASGGGVTGGKEGSTVPMTEVLDDEVLKEQLTRNIQFFGEKAQLDLANAFVVVVGLGVSVRRVRKYCCRPRGR